jgi:hypothetical protein
MQPETAIVSTCKCGWIAVSGTVQESTKLLDEHVAWEGPEGHSGKPMAITNPLNTMATVFLRQQAGYYRDQKNTLDQIRRLSEPNQPRVVDDGLGAFRGMWFVIKGWMIAVVVAGCLYGLWRLR